VPNDAAGASTACGAHGGCAFVVVDGSYPVFARPVDPANDGCPDYFNVIKYPMDLGTIQSRLHKGTIEDPEDFIVHVRIVFRNAYVYNQKETPVYKAAELLSRKFEEHVDALRAAPRML